MKALIRESFAEYREKSVSYLTSHGLADFRKCPLLFKKKRMGEIEEVDSSAFLIGRALHTLALEGREAFDAEYIVGGPVNPKTGEPYGTNTKAFADWVAQHGKQPITYHQFEMIERMANAVSHHAVAKELFSDGVAERVVRVDYCGVPAQARIDWLSLNHFPERCLIELKTCDDLAMFEYDCRKYGYVHQLAFYLALLKLVEIDTTPFLVAVEKREPYRCGVWHVTERVITIATQENESTIERLRRCMDSDRWPTGYEECNVLDTL